MENMTLKIDSLVRLVPVGTKPPGLQDNTGDIDRLLRALKAKPGFGSCCLRVPYDRLMALAAAFRRADFSGVAVLNGAGGCPGGQAPGEEVEEADIRGAEGDRVSREREAHGHSTREEWFELVDFLPEMPRVLPGLALDLGTTHLEAVLLDLLSGKELARGTRPNSQVLLGEDVLSRVHFAADRADSHSRELPGLLQLQQAVIADVNALAAELSEAAGVKRAEIRALSVAGNTIMGHLFLKLDPRQLCREPYIPVVNAPGPPAANQLGLELHPAASVHLLPGVGSYFGGDLLAGIVACDLDLAEEPEMLIDVGTNAEVVVGCREWLVACAGAAGPALEGGVAKMGMRAAPGVIERVRIDPASGELSFNVIPLSVETGGEVVEAGSAGGTTSGVGSGEADWAADAVGAGGDKIKVKGICGSGMIDLMAEMFLAGFIDIRGKFRPRRMGSRLLDTGDGPAFMVVSPEESGSGAPVSVSQVDLDSLLRSKAAMYSILETLMEQVGLPFKALKKIHVAGAFGRHIDPRQAVVLGMIPDLPLDTYQPVGNSSLAGARLYLTRADIRDRVREVAKKITYLELNVNHEFMIRFSGSRFIPHTDRTLFPSVPM